MLARSTAGEDRLHREFVEATGVTDVAIIEDLRRLGYTPETVRLLHLVPLVEVAWSEGNVTQRERKVIYDIAHMRGIRYGSAAYEQLVAWLAEEPSKDFFDGTLDALRSTLEASPERVRSSSMRSLLTHCMSVAAASRAANESTKGNICDREYSAIERIAAALSGDGEPTASRRGGGKSGKSRRGL